MYFLDDGVFDNNDDTATSVVVVAFVVVVDMLVVANFVEDEELSSKHSLLCDSVK